jgi:hypothetical protein
MAAILSPHGLYRGNRKSKITLLNNKGYKPLKGGFGSLCHRSIGRKPGDRNLLSLDASLAIPTCVLRFEDCGLRRRTSVRPVLLTGQTVSYGPPWAHCLGGYQDRLLGGPLGLPGLRYTAPEGVEHKDNT